MKYKLMGNIGLRHVANGLKRSKMNWSTYKLTNMFEDYKLRCLKKSMNTKLDKTIVVLLAITILVYGITRYIK